MCVVESATFKESDWSIQGFHSHRLANQALIGQSNTTWSPAYLCILDDNIDPEISLRDGRGPFLLLRGFGGQVTDDAQGVVEMLSYLLSQWITDRISEYSLTLYENNNDGIIIDCSSKILSRPQFVNVKADHTGSFYDSFGIFLKCNDAAMFYYKRTHPNTYLIGRMFHLRDCFSFAVTPSPPPKTNT